MALLTEELCGYLAGLLDGDGSITIVNRSNKGFRIKLCVYNCDIRVANFLVNLFGGKIRSNHINDKHAKWRNCIEYSIQDLKASDLIRRLLPFLIAKKAQALIALEAALIKAKYSATEKRWSPNLKIECNNRLKELKEQINILNTRGTQKQFSIIDIKNIPFNMNYLAGFCDADGSIMINKSGKYYTSKITFSNTDKNLIDWINFNIGGDIYIKLRKNNKWNTLYELSFSSAKACALAKLLHPLLLIKKRQAKLVITIGKIKGLYSAATLRWDRDLNARYYRSQEKIRTICKLLNSRSA